MMCLLPCALPSNWIEQALREWGQGVSMMNKYFLEDFDQVTQIKVTTDLSVAAYPPEMVALLYIAEKLWSIEQLLKNQEQR